MLLKNPLLSKCKFCSSVHVALRTIAVAIMIASIMAGIGHVVHDEKIAELWVGAPAMAVSTAVCFFLTACAILLLAMDKGD